jgi:hypothetical protein
MPYDDGVSLVNAAKPILAEAKARADRPDHADHITVCRVPKLCLSGIVHLRLGRRKTIATFLIFVLT